MSIFVNAPAIASPVFLIWFAIENTSYTVISMTSLAVAPVANTTDVPEVAV